ncbi:MAG TPA: type III secretion system translocon subunit SctE, partial [Caulifigura sp.]|nr:type III secretion system translocon subunit SctE [Caulifigura sp.]
GSSVGAAGTLPPTVETTGTLLNNEQIKQFQTFFDANNISFVANSSGFIGSDGQLLDPPAMSPDDALAILMSLQAKLGDESKNTALEGVSHNKDSQKVAREEQMKKLLQAAEEAKKAAQSGLIGKIFGWIGAALAVIAAIAVTVATLGAAAPVSGLAIAGVVAAVMGAVLGGATQIVSSIPGAMEAMGPEGAKAFMFTMMALQIACAITSIGAGAGSVSNAANSAANTAVNTAANTAAKTVEEAVEASTALATKVEIAASKAGQVAQIGQGAVEVGEGATSIATAEFEKNAAYNKADVQEILKWLKAIAAQDEQAIEFIKAIQEMQDKGWGVVVDVAKEHNELNQSLMQNMQSGNA